MQERIERPDPVRPESPSRAGWVLDPWGDGQRFWDGEIWTGRTRELDAASVADDAAGHAEPKLTGSPGMPGEPDGDDVRGAPVTNALPGPRDYELLDDPDEDGDERPFRSGLLRGMVWAFAVVAIIAMLLTAVSVWPMLQRGVPSVPEPPAVPQQSVQRA